MNKNIHTFIGCDDEYEESKIVIFGAPLMEPLPIGREPALPLPI